MREIGEVENYYKENKDNVLFRYTLSDAWHIPVQTIIVINKEKDNCLYCDEDSEVKYISIEKNIIEKLFSIIDKNNGLFKIKNIEEPLVLDGCINDLYFSNLKSNKKIVTSNLWAYVDDENAPENAKLVINVFNEISDLLNKYDINISLDLPDDFIDEDE